MSSKFFLIFLLFCISNAIFLKVNPLSVNEPNDLGVEQYFDQLLDHSQPTSLSTWKQRIFVYDQYFDQNKGAAILYICGEWTCNGLGSATFALTLAQRYNATVFAVEHRFFGASQPLGYGADSQTTQTYEKYLTVQQALDDLAYFITQTTREGSYGIKSNMPWMTIGGSYPGALSAWFRYKYPHLTVGALADSAVIEAILDYDQFDAQVRDSTSKSGQYCPDVIYSATLLAETMAAVPEQREQLMKQFGTEGLTDAQFFGYIADATAGMVQSGKRTQLCALLTNKTAQEGLNVIRLLSIGQAVESYTVDGLKNTTYDKNSNSRQWFFQTCTELGYFQTPSKTGQPLRSSTVDIQFYKQLCVDVFGQNSQGDDFWANADHTNAYLGGKNLNVKNLIITNGSEDPWKHASIFQPIRGGDVEIILTECDNCAHCADTKGPRDSDPQALKDTRKRITALFDLWVSDHWASKDRNPIQ